MKKFISSIGFALAGIQVSWKQNNFKLELFSAFIVSSAGFYFSISYFEWCILLICFGLVLSLELINTALEHFVDLLSPNYHEKAKKVKDISAAAVLISAIFSLIIGILIFKPYFIHLLES